jgi:hypothetical protein
MSTRLPKLWAASMLAAMLVPARAVAGENVETVRSETMDFERCVGAVALTIAQLNASPSRIIPIVDTSIMLMTKVVGDDANYIFTCSKPDRKFLLTQSTPPDLHLVR